VVPVDYQRITSRAPAIKPMVAAHLKAAEASWPECFQKNEHVKFAVCSITASHVVVIRQRMPLPGAPTSQRTLVHLAAEISDLHPFPKPGFVPKRPGAVAT